ncbi:MAG: DUF3368 domain-containing protein [Bacteroidota bacterium]
MPELVIADTSCLIVLSKIGRLHLLKDIFSKISITEEVHQEFGDALPEWIQVEETKDSERKRILELDLDKGEASSIVLGLENKEALLLIDEKKGRRVAKDLGLKVTGTLGVLIRAKVNGQVSSLKDEIDKLKKVEFRMSEVLVQQILETYEN